MARRRVARRRSSPKRRRRTMGSMGSIPRGKCKKTRTGAFICKLSSGKTRIMSRAQANRFMK